MGTRCSPWFRNIWKHRWKHSGKISSSFKTPCRAPSPAVLSPKSRSATWKCSGRSEEHTSELQSLMRISYAVLCLKKKNTEQQNQRATKYNKASQLQHNNTST